MRSSDRQRLTSVSVLVLQSMKFLDHLTFQDIIDEPVVTDSPPESALGFQQQPQQVKEETAMDSQVFDDHFNSMFGESEGAEERSGSDGMLESLMKIDIDPDYWDKIDIDSLDPEWPESEQQEEEEDETK